MIRYTNSFLFSFTIHAILLFIIFYTVKSIAFSDNNKKDNTVCVKLCNIKYQDESPTLAKAAENQPSAKKPKVQKKETQHVKVDKPLPAPTPKKAKVKIEKKAEPVQVKEELVIKQDVVKKESRTKEKVEQEAVQKPAEPPVLPIAKNNPSCNCKGECMCDSKQDTKENKKIKEEKAAQAYVNDNMKEIVKLLQENLYYPRRARELEITDEVKVKFIIDTKGEVKSAQIVSSKSDLLSHAALKTINDISGKFPKPKENLVITLPINYSLK